MKIRKKCEYAFKNDRHTDQDKLLGFMKPYVKTKKENILPTAPLLKTLPRCFPDDGESTPTSEEVQPQKKQKQPITPEDDDSSGWEVSEEEISIEDESAPKKAVVNKGVNVYDSDPYCLAIRKSFNEVAKERQLSAMIHLCKKLEEFRLSAEK